MGRQILFYYVLWDAKYQVLRTTGLDLKNDDVVNWRTDQTLAFKDGDIGPKVLDGERDRLAVEAVGRVSHQLYC